MPPSSLSSPVPASTNTTTAAVRSRGNGYSKSFPSPSRIKATLSSLGGGSISGNGGNNGTLVSGKIEWRKDIAQALQSGQWESIRGYLNIQQHGLTDSSHNSDCYSTNDDSSVSTKSTPIQTTTSGGGGSISSVNKVPRRSCSGDSIGAYTKPQRTSSGNSIGGGFWKRFSGRGGSGSIIGVKERSDLLLQDSEGRTVLHMALGSRKTPSDVILCLISLEPIVASLANKRGRLPLHFAIVHRHSVEVISSLIDSYPAALSAPDNKGHTPLSYAMDIAKHESDLRNAPRTFWMPLNGDDHHHGSTKIAQPRADIRNVHDTCTIATTTNTTTTSTVLTTEREGSEAEIAAQWQEKQEERWSIVQWLLMSCATYPQTGLSGVVDGKNKPMLVDALLHAAPPTVVSLLIGASSMLLTNERNRLSAFAGSTLYTCITRHYPLSILVNLTLQCKRDAAKLRDETGLGLVSAQFICGCFAQNKETLDWSVDETFYQALLQVIETGQIIQHPGREQHQQPKQQQPPSLQNDSYTHNCAGSGKMNTARGEELADQGERKDRNQEEEKDREQEARPKGQEQQQEPQEQRQEPLEQQQLHQQVRLRPVDSGFYDWWRKMEFLISFCCPSYTASDGDVAGSINPSSIDRKYLLHAALMNVDTPPLVIRALLSLYPESVHLRHPESGALPIHLVCQNSEYIPRNYEMLMMGNRESILSIILSADPSAISQRCENRLPIHYATLSGRSFDRYSELINTPCATGERSGSNHLLGQVDPITNLYPVLLAALRLQNTDAANRSKIRNNVNDVSDSFRWTCIARNKYSYVVWKSLSDRQKAAAVLKVTENEDLEKLSSIFQLLRLNPAVAGSHRIVANEGHDQTVATLQMISTHYTRWCYHTVTYPNNHARRQQHLLQNHGNVSMLNTVIRTSKEDGFFSNSPSPEFDLWWNEMKHCIWASYNLITSTSPNGGPDDVCKIPNDDLYLLHAAVSTPDTPPKVIELILAVYPESSSLPLPAATSAAAAGTDEGTTKQYPLHIVARTVSYTPRPYEYNNADGRSNALELVLNSNPGATRIPSNAEKGRLPIHIALAYGGRTWEEMFRLIDAEPSTLTTQDPITGLYPFQLASSRPDYTSWQRLRFQEIAKNAVGKTTNCASWTELSAIERVKNIQQVQCVHELYMLTCSFEILKRSAASIMNRWVRDCQGVVCLAEDATVSGRCCTNNQLKKSKESLPKARLRSEDCTPASNMSMDNEEDGQCENKAHDGSELDPNQPDSDEDSLPGDFNLSPRRTVEPSALMELLSRNTKRVDNNGNNYVIRNDDSCSQDSIFECDTSVFSTIDVMSTLSSTIHHNPESRNVSTTTTAGRQMKVILQGSELYARAAMDDAIESENEEGEESQEDYNKGENTNKLSGTICLYDFEDSDEDLAEFAEDSQVFQGSITADYPPVTQESTTTTETTRTETLDTDQQRQVSANGPRYEDDSLTTFLTPNKQQKDRVQLHENEDFIYFAYRRQPRISRGRQQAKLGVQLKKKLQDEDCSKASFESPVKVMPTKLLSATVHEDSQQAPGIPALLLNAKEDDETTFSFAQASNSTSPSSKRGGSYHASQSGGSSSETSANKDGKTESSSLKTDSGHSSTSYASLHPEDLRLNQSSADMMWVSQEILGSKLFTEGFTLGESTQSMLLAAADSPMKKVDASPHKKQKKPRRSLSTLNPRLLGSFHSFGELSDDDLLLEVNSTDGLQQLDSPRMNSPTGANNNTLPDNGKQDSSAGTVCGLLECICGLTECFLLPEDAKRQVTNTTTCRTVPVGSSAVGVTDNRGKANEARGCSDSRQKNSGLGLDAANDFLVSGGAEQAEKPMRKASNTAEKSQSERTERVTAAMSPETTTDKGTPRTERLEDVVRSLSTMSIPFEQSESSDDAHSQESTSTPSSTKSSSEEHNMDVGGESLGTNDSSCTDPRQSISYGNQMLSSVEPACYFDKANMRWKRTQNAQDSFATTETSGVSLEDSTLMSQGTDAYQADSSRTLSTLVSSQSAPSVLLDRGNLRWQPNPPIIKDQTTNITGVKNGGRNEVDTLTTSPKAGRTALHDSSTILRSTHSAPSMAFDKATMRWERHAASREQMTWNRNRLAQAQQKSTAASLGNILNLGGQKTGNGFQPDVRTQANLHDSFVTQGTCRTSQSEPTISFDKVKMRWEIRGCNEVTQRTLTNQGDHAKIRTGNNGRDHRVARATFHDSFTTQGTCRTSQSAPAAYFFDKKNMRWQRPNTNDIDGDEFSSRTDDASRVSSQSVQKRSGMDTARSAASSSILGGSCHSRNSILGGSCHSAAGSVDSSTAVYFGREKMRWQGSPRGQDLLLDSSDHQTDSVLLETEAEECLFKNQLNAGAEQSISVGVGKSKPNKLSNSDGQKDDRYFDRKSMRWRSKSSDSPSLSGAASSSSTAPKSSMVTPFNPLRRKRGNARTPKTGTPFVEVFPKEKRTKKTAAILEAVDDQVSNSASYRVAAAESGSSMKKMGTANHDEVRRWWKTMFKSFAGGGQLTCLICHRNSREVLTLPCRHLAICQECSSKHVQACPLCGGTVTGGILVF